MRWAMVSLLGAAAAVGVACGSAPAPAPSTPPASPATPASSVATRPAHTVSAVVLVNGCAHLGVTNARLAQAAMNQLVDGCSAFSGSRVQFTATLLPGGTIQFEPRPNESQSIPICVVNHPLSHHVKLDKACSLEVRLEEGSTSVHSAADAGP